MSSRQDWRTPPSIFAQLSRDFGPFELDCAADDKNHFCERYYTVENNAIVRPWNAPWFVNIPFGDPMPWVKKASNASSPGVMLCLASLSADWFHYAMRCAGLLIPDRRINYWHPDEIPLGRSFDRDSVIFLFGYPEEAGVRSYFIAPHAEEIRRLWSEANGQSTLFSGGARV